MAKLNDGWIENNEGVRKNIIAAGPLLTKKEMLIGTGLLLITGLAGVGIVGVLCRRAWHNGAVAYSTGFNKALEDLGVLDK